YDWPGNVRELRNVLERACSFWDGLRLGADAVAAALPPGHAEWRPVGDGEGAAREPRPVAQAPEPRGDGAPYERTTAAERRHGAGAAPTAGAHLVDEGQIGRAAARANA